MVAFSDPIDHLVRNLSLHYDFPIDSFCRLLVAMIAGGLVGLEREVRGRQAGFRTNILVCLGSALVMIVSISFAEKSWPHDAGININVDPARIAYGVMTGIGFLGAGAIVKNGVNIRGLTTAAGLWCVAAIGLASGFGLYVITFFATVLVVACLWLLDYVEDSIPKVRYRNVTVRRTWESGCIARTVERFKDAGLYVVDASFERTPDLKRVDITLHVAFVNSNQYYSLERELQDDQILELIAAREI